MISIDDNLKYTIYFYLLLSILLYYFKPKIFFDDVNNFKQFGTDNNKTLMPFWLFTQMICIIFYFLLVIKSSDYI